MKKTINRFVEASLTTKLISMFILIIGIPALAISLISFREMQSLVKEQLYVEAVNSVTISGENIDEMLFNMVQAVYYISDDAKIKEFSTLPYEDSSEYRVQKVMLINHLNDIVPKVVYGRISLSSDIYVFNENEMFYSKSGRASSFDRRVLKKLEEYYTEGYDNHTDSDGFNPIQWRVSEAVEYDGVHIPARITASRDIMDKLGNKRAIVTIEVYHDDLWKKIQDDHLGNNRLLFDRSGTLISMDSDLLSESDQAEIATKVTDHAENVFETELESLGNSIVSFRKLEDTEWVLTEVRPYSLMEEAMRSVLYRQMFFAVAYIVIFIVFLLFVVRNITRPIHDLSAMMINTELKKSNEISGTFTANEVKHLEKSYSIMLKNINELMTHNQEAEQQKREAELKALRSQISPHFLFNTLSAIRFTIDNKKNEKASQMILALTRLLDTTIVRLDEMITVEDQIDNARSYVELINLRHDKEISLKSMVDEDCRGCHLPKLIMQPLVENSLFHGFEGCDTGEITIRCSSKGKDMEINIEDNGNGFDVKVVEDKPPRDKLYSIGLKNVDERIRVRFGKHYGLVMSSEEGSGTKVKILVPKMKGHSHV